MPEWESTGKLRVANAALAEKVATCPPHDPCIVNVGVNRHNRVRWCRTCGSLQVGDGEWQRPENVADRRSPR